MSGLLAGKRAVITAAAQGIGRAAAEAFQREGAIVTATDVNEEKLAELSALGMNVAKLDVMNADAISAFAAQTGTIDVLFNCAGTVHAGTILEASERDYDLAFDLNVKSMFRLIRAVLPGMIDNGGGSIINMSSVAGVPMGVPNRFVYSASKAAVIGLTKSIALDYIKQGIRCNAIAPGVVDTPALAANVPPEQVEMFTRSAVTPTLGKPDDIAGVAVWLLSDEARFITGQVINVDGGMAMHTPLYGELIGQMGQS
jgi:2-keto-3-deoxy-L-fuconate dehydrogenase